MFKVEWKVNGRTVRPDQVGQELMKGVRDAVTTEIEETVAGVRCPVHGRQPTDVRRVPSCNGDMNIEFQTCCEELRAAVALRFR